MYLNSYPFYHCGTYTTWKMKRNSNFNGLVEGSEPISSNLWRCLKKGAVNLLSSFKTLQGNTFIEILYVSKVSSTLIVSPRGSTFFGRSIASVGENSGLSILARPKISVGFDPNNTFGHASTLIEAIFHIKIITLFQTGHQLHPPEWLIVRLLV